MKSNELLYEDTSRYDLWVKILLSGTLVFTFILGVVFLFFDTLAAVILFSVTAFDYLLFKAIMPRRLQVFEDRMRIILGGPVAVNVSLANIKEARIVDGSTAIVYWGLKFATSTKAVVEIVREHGMDMVISPSHAETFIEELKRARESWIGRAG